MRNLSVTRNLTRQFECLSKAKDAEVQFVKGTGCRFWQVHPAFHEIDSAVIRD
jgi:hypothetical protein